MIDLADLGARRLTALPVAPQHVRTIEAFDGPLLSEFQTEAGDTFLYCWCDRDDSHNRWLVIRTPRPDLFSYLVGKRSLRSLIVECRDQFVYVVDLTHQQQLSSAYYLTIPDLPPSYTPHVDSRHQPEIAETDHHQDVFVNDIWGYEEVSEYPRKYLQAYAFQGNFAEGGIRRPATVDYKLDGGWAYHTLFGKLRGHIPEEQRASLEAVSVASPGYVRFNVDPKIAASLRDTVSKFLARKDIILGTTQGLRRWYLGHDRMTDEQATRQIETLSASLGVSAATILARSDSIQNAAKALASYVTRISFLAEKDASETAMMVGRPRTAPDADSDEPTPLRAAR